MSRKKSVNKNDQSKAKLDDKTTGEKQSTNTLTQNPTAKKTNKIATKTNVSEQGAKKKVTNRKKTATKKATKTSTETRQQANPQTQTNSSGAVSTSTVSNVTPKSGRGIAWFALLCSLAALAAGGYAAYQTSISQQVTGTQVTGFDDRLKLVVSDQQSIKGGFDSLNQKTEQREQSVDTQVKKLSTDLSTVQTSVTALQTVSDDSIEEVKSNLGASVARWQLDELHALLSQVNQYYQFTGDKALAINGLKLAQSKLSTIANPRASSVGSALAEDLLRLESIESIDVAALNNRLSGIAALIPELKFMADKAAAAEPKPAEKAASVAKASTPENKGFLSAGKALLGDLGSLVQHKKLDAPLKLSLDDSARFVLYKSLQLKIQAANISLLRRDNAVYQSQLKQASEALQADFDLQEPGAATIMGELEAMQTQDISMKTQAISKALSALDKLMVLEN